MFVEFVAISGSKRIPPNPAITRPIATVKGYHWQQTPDQFSEYPRPIAIQSPNKINPIPARFICLIHKIPN